VGVPILERTSDDSTRSINNLENIFVAITSRPRTIFMQNEISMLKATIMIHQPSIGVPAVTNIHNLANGYRISTLSATSIRRIGHIICFFNPLDI